MAPRSISYRFVLVCSVAMLVALVWYGSLIMSLVRPALVRSSIVSAAVPTVDALRDETIYLKKLDLVAPITQLPNTDPLSFLDWNKIRPTLLNGVAATYKGDDFGHASTVFVIGHSSDTYPHHYASVFAPLGQVKLGDEVTFVTQARPYRFTITDKKVISPTDKKAFNDLQNSNPDMQRLLLVTCWPILTSTNRLVVTADRTR